MDSIVIIGASGHCKVIIDIIEKRNEYIIMGLIDSYKTAGENIMGYPILGNESLIPDLLNTQKIIGGIIAIGDNWVRSEMCDTIKALAPTFKFLPAIHPNAILYNNLHIQEGVVIMAGAIVNSGSTIEAFCFLNTKASLGHDSIMHPFASLAPNVTIAGQVEIGAFSAISISATISNAIKIGSHTVIGASALVLKDVEDLVVAYGIPAKKIRSRRIGDVYL